MKTAGEERVTLGILDCVIKITSEINESDEDKYNQLILEFSQRVDCALTHEVRIPVVTKQEVLELSNKLKKLAKHFPSES